ncbi:MAG: hypothetical protein K0B02_01425 [DPANN group archaeon]|nr:hypothetical protein [DPANN group archaeon]
MITDCIAEQGYGAFQAFGKTIDLYEKQNPADIEPIITKKDYERVLRAKENMMNDCIAEQSFDTFQELGRTIELYKEQNPDLF